MENKKISVWLVDLDGTLCHNNGHRSFYDESKVFDDTPLPTVLVIQSLIASGDNIIFLSGRTDECKDETIKWLTYYVDSNPPTLFMRNKGDNRPDDIIKKELYETHIKPNYVVLGVFDDRKKVKRMWVQEGLFVLDCNQHDKEF